MAKPRGRPFTEGNTASRGRPPGSRNKNTLWSEELIGEYREAVLRKCLAMALQGDSTAMRLCVERILPIRKESRIQLKMAKVSTMAEVAAALDRVLQAVGRGAITPEQGQRLADLLQGRGRIIESEEMEARLRVLERVHGVDPKPGDAAGEVRWQAPRRSAEISEVDELGFRDMETNETP